MRVCPVTCATLLLAALLALVAGCENDNDILPPIVLHTPLEIDPMEPVVISEWWSNGTEMLHLRADGSYHLFARANRYDRPRERGRWSRPSYAYIRLEPYSPLRTEAKRASLVMLDEKVALLLPKLAPMRPLDGPPRVLEDDVIGWWSGAVGELVLQRGGTYRYYPMPDEFGEPARVAGHRGRWRIEETTVHLKPNPPGFDEFALLVAQEGEAYVLQSEGGPLARTDRPIVDGL